MKRKNIYKTKVFHDRTSQIFDIIHFIYPFDHIYDQKKFFLSLKK